MRLSLFTILASTMISFGQTSYPMITHVSPVAVQRGKTTEVVVEGQMNFEGVHTLLIEGKGVRGEIIAIPPTKAATGTAVVRSVRLKFTVEENAALGVREFRLASRLGISTLGQILIADDPVISEAGDNNTIAKAQKIAVPTVVHGRIEALEDVDCFSFKAKAGQTMTFEIFCARIQDKIHDLQKHADPLVALFDSSGKELNASDDAIFADPLMSYTFTKDDDYIVQIRDAKYDGDPRWVYALALTDRPRVAQLFPLAMNPEKTLEVEPVGSAKLISPRISILSPKERGIQPIQFLIGKEQSNPAACVVTDLPLAEEHEPNDSRAEANFIQVPGGVNGRVGKRRDSDFFRFKATKGKAIRFEVFARRFGSILNSQLDSMIEVTNSQGVVLLANDDLNGKDAGLVFSAPADGEYYLRLRDLTNKGGESFIYYLEADFARPDFTIKCDPSKAMIGPGSRTAWYAQIVRQNGFTGPVKVSVRGLPKEVTVNELTIPPTMTQGLLVLTASKEATKPFAANVEVVGTAEVEFDQKKEMIEKIATPIEEIYLPGGGRGRFDVRMQSIAVTEQSDILEVKVSKPKLTLKPGEEAKIDVEIVRRKDYDKAVSLDIPLRHLGQVYGVTLPPGVTLVEGKSKTLIGTGNTGYITIKAEANAAEIADVPICVLAHVSINFVVKVSYSSEPILISVKK